MEHILVDFTDVDKGLNAEVIKTEAGALFDRFIEDAKTEPRCFLIMPIITSRISLLDLLHE